ncbi:MAG: ABC transporter permease [Firmicutes bacterium]|nr:ABC transporter permease [Bacillota bacterium]
MTGRFLVRRVLSLLITLFIIITVIFFLFRVLPGDAADYLVDPLSSEELKTTVRKQLGLDRPILVQYGLYLLNLVKGDLGNSFVYGRPVSTLVVTALLNSLPLVVITWFIAYFVGGFIGVLFAWKRGSIFEKVGSLLVLIIRGAPPFWIGLMLVYLFALYLGWFPESGMHAGIRGEGDILALWFSSEFPRYLILPVMTASIYSLALPLLLMRGSMLDVLHEDYLDLARAKGLKEWVVIFRHGARNALLPMVAQSGTYLGWAVGGLVTIEVVFAWPGMGRLIAYALLSRDFPLAQGAFVGIALLVMLLYLVVDFLIPLLDPRAELE